MRLILLLLLAPVALTFLILALERLSYRLVPWSIGDALTRAFVWTCAHLMDRVHEVALRLRLWNLADRVDPCRLHVTAVALGRVCRPCAEEAAPGWWDWDADCADHLCGTCETCAWNAEADAREASGYVRPDTRLNRSRTHTEA